MSQTRRRRAMRLFAVAIACATLPAAPALASTSQLSVIEDEHQMLDLGPAVQARALDDAKALGADVVRANVIWSHFAPKPRNKRKPRRFDGKNPAKYSAAKWAPLDGFVAGAQARGLRVMLTPTGPTPAWASRCKGSVKVRARCKPDPHEFGAFVRALGKRYQRVNMWSIWNEPNLKSWLSPQYEVVGGRPVLRSAALYRALARSAIAGLRGTGHRRHAILLGETAPVGDNLGTCRVRSGRSRVRCYTSRIKAGPVQFLRGLFCLTGGGHRLTGAAGSLLGCTHPSRLNVTGFAHHPYTRGGFQPPLAKPNANDITVAVPSRLTRILDQAGKRKRVPRRLPVFYTENGWQTNPPDPIGVTPDQQAAYINQSDWTAYRNPRIKSVAQYKIIDDADDRSFQTGVRYPSGRAKPSYRAYRLPIWVSGRGAQLTVYGQVRPADDAATLQVDIQHAAGAGSAFQTVQTVTVSSKKGQFTARVPNQGGVWRLRSGGLVSRAAQAAPR